MIRRPPRSTLDRSSAASDVYKRQVLASLLIAAFYIDGPYPFPPRPFAWSLVHTVVERREWRLATSGYLGHMFELYSFWTWIPLFLAASVAAQHGSTANSAGTA